MSLTDRLLNDPKLATVLIICIIFVCVAVVGFGCACYCRSKYGESGQAQPRSECVKCQLIDMGEMACYTGTCPGCGRVPPSLQSKV